MRKVALIPAYEPDDKLIQLAKELKNREFYCIIIDDGSGTKYFNIFKEYKKMHMLFHIMKIKEKDMHSKQDLNI